MEASMDWYDRGYLPHRSDGALIQFVTYRLWDSVPEEAREGIEIELASGNARNTEAKRQIRLQQLLDSGRGSCVLSIPEIATCIVETLLKFNGERYDLYEWVVMPNHVHVLFKAREGWKLPKIIQSWKSYTGRRALELLASRGIGYSGRELQHQTLWMREYWDRYIRDEEHLQTAKDYIRNNPVKARLVARPEDWPWGSAGWHKRKG